MKDLDDRDGFEDKNEELARLISEVQERERARNTMKLHEAVERACKEPTLAEALSWIAVWECDRAVKQALKSHETDERTPEGGTYETCFTICFKDVLAKYHTPTTKDRSPAC